MKIYTNAKAPHAIFPQCPLHLLLFIIWPKNYQIFAILKYAHKSNQMQNDYANYKI